MTVDVEATETTVPALLESIERGDEVRLLRNGRAVAEVTPRRSREVIEQAQAAFAGADDRARKLGLKFDMDELKADRQQGRR